MSSSERSIPHLRDIFSISNYTMHSNHPGMSNGNNNNQFNGSPAGYGVGDPYTHHSQLPPVIPTIEQTAKKHSKKKRDNSKTLTSGDVKTLERHLSMKKTIRKKIMRDLQQAFVDDPNEFKIENTNHEQLKAEIRAEAFRFGDKPTATTPARKADNNFLDMLRGEKSSSSYGNGNGLTNRDYDYDSPPNVQPAAEKQSFWRRFTMKGKAKR